MVESNPSWSFEDLTIRTPTRGDLRSYKAAWKKLSAEDKHRYIRQHLGERAYLPSRVCSKASGKGWMFTILSIRDAEDLPSPSRPILGFAHFEILLSSEAQLHKLPEGEKGCSSTIILLEEFRHQGWAEKFGILSETIARDLGCEWALGNTYTKGGMWGIRQKMGWECVGYIREIDSVIIRKRM